MTYIACRPRGWSSARRRLKTPDPNLYAYIHPAPRSPTRPRPYNIIYPTRRRRRRRRHRVLMRRTRHYADAPSGRFVVRAAAPAAAWAAAGTSTPRRRVSRDTGYRTVVAPACRPIRTNGKCPLQRLRDAIRFYRRKLDNFFGPRSPTDEIINIPTVFTVPEVLLP